MKNMNVTPSKMSGTPKMGDSKADANMPANNITNNGPALGTTKHGVGKVPGYLRSK